ncbi:MAG: NAD(P)H-dependent oxidoreductase subunit E [Chloroflexi bacterium]|nr:NAD(P)H-dependent oxidoreductase subunit E [Chloroflexota bacterium]
MNTSEPKLDNEQIKTMINAILDKYRREEGMLVSVLHEIQGEYHYLPRPALEEVSRGLKIPLTRVYSVATFFKVFSLKPRGRHLIQVCLGTACHVRGGARVRDTIERDLAIKSGETTPDFTFSLESVNCVGACALGPIVLVDGQYNGQMTIEKVDSVLKKYA